MGSINKLIVFLFLFLCLISSAFALVDNHGLTMTDSEGASGCYWRGTIITANKDIRITEITLASGDTAPKIGIRNVSGVVITESATSSESATFDYLLNDGDSIMIVAGDDSGSWTAKRKATGVTYPISGTNIEWTGPGKFVSSCPSTFDDGTSTMYSILSVTSEEQSAISININITAPENNTATQSLLTNFSYIPLAIDSIVSNCSLMTNKTGSWVNDSIDTTITNNISNTFEDISFSKGSYNWSIQCFDNNSNYTDVSEYILNITNTAPTDPTSVLDNTPVYVTDKLIITGQGSTDINSDDIYYYYEFYNNNDAGVVQAYSLQDNYTLQISDAHDSIRVRVIASDLEDNSSSYYEENFSVSNTAPGQVFNWVFPSDIEDSDNYNITFDWDAITDTDGDTIYYEFYLDDILKQNTTDTSWVADFEVEKKYNYSVISHDGYINGVASYSRNFTLDTTIGIITWNYPSVDVVSKENLTLDIIGSDDNLYQCYVNVSNSTGSQIYYEFMDLINTTTCVFDAQVNFTYTDNYSINFGLNDDHTDGEQPSKGKKGETELLFNKNNGKDENNGKESSNVAFYFIEKSDKLTDTPGDTYVTFTDGDEWDINFTALKPETKIIFNISSSTKIVDRSYKGIEGHLLWGGYYHDFSVTKNFLVNGEKRTAKIYITKVDDNNYQIKWVPDINLKAGDEVYIDPYSGGLNNVSETKYYYYDSTKPSYDNVVYQTPVKINTNININVTWSDDISIGSWILSNNQTGTYVNSTLNTTFNGNIAESYLDITLSRGSILGWVMYGIDSVGNINVTTIQTIVIDNTAPSTGNPSLSTTTPATSQILTCNPGSYVDSDSDPKNNDFYKWYLNDSFISGEVSSTLDLSTPGNGDADDRIKCTWIADDGYDNSSSGWLNTTEAVVLNTDTINYINRTPENNSINTGNGVWVEVEFVIGLENISDCIIEFDGINYTGNVEETYCYEQFAGLTDGTNYSFRTFVNDTNGEEFNLTLRTFTENSLQNNPTIDSLFFNATPRGNEDVNCYSNITGNDPEGNTTYFVYDVYVNGTFKFSQNNVQDNVTISEIYYNSGDTIYCYLTLFDGYENTSTINISTLVSNELPNVTNVNISGEFDGIYIYSNASVIGNYTYDDTEGNNDLSDMGFWVNSTFYNTTNNSLNSIYTSKGDVVIFQVIPYDGIDYGSGVNSTGVNITGVPPKLLYLSPSFGYYNGYVPVTCYGEDMDNATIYYNVDMRYDNGSGSKDWYSIISNQSIGSSLLSLKNVTAQNNVSIRCNITTDHINYVSKQYNGTIIFQDEPMVKITYEGARDLFVSKIPYYMGVECNTKSAKTNVTIYGSWADCENDGVKDYYWVEGELSPISRSRTQHTFKCVSLEGDVEVSVGCIFEKVNSTLEWQDICTGVSKNSNLCTYKKGVELEVLP